ncbi:thioredoxin family protein [Aquariibacter lacus]|uniref:thioredoxin family protein n=1 Tax=Aquariibacter lacus TaxID=2801332 RepID=UPI002573FB69|nr:thioredoxin family protein [Piscinibacter lacus]
MSHLPARRILLQQATALTLGATLLAGAGVAGAARPHGLPAAYGAMVQQPATLPRSAEFDLGPALARARAEGKRLYVYLSADDCAYCRRYEAFLAANHEALKSHFSPYLLVDLRSSLRVPVRELRFKTPTLGSLPYAEFQKAIGDERARQLVYPSVWLLDAQGQPLMQMPAGAGTFETVPEQIEVLQLVQ